MSSQPIEIVQLAPQRAVTVRRTLPQKDLGAFSLRAGYSVRPSPAPLQTSGTNYVDAGHLVIYAGVTPERISEVIEASLSEVAKLRDALVPDDELERVRDFNKGRIELRLEDSRGVSNWLAGQELFLDRVRSVDEVIAIIDSVSAADVQRVARQYLKPELSYIAAVGPRAAIANVNVPSAEVVDMEIAS